MGKHPIFVDLLIPLPSLLKIIALILYMYIREVMKKVNRYSILCFYKSYSVHVPEMRLRLSSLKCQAIPILMTTSFDMKFFSVPCLTVSFPLEFYNPLSNCKHNGNDRSPWLVYKRSNILVCLK